RRVLYGMNDLGLLFNKSHKKSARIVGEVLGKYHPHGDSSVYDSMVRMAQEWSLRYPLVDGQGNFGSMDGDSPAAMRYTEARLAKISDTLMDDLGKDTVDWQLNFDDSLKEPTVLPTRLPNLLINGSSGIAVGMATNMMPHNLSDVVDAILATVDNPDIDIEELIEIVKAPDFPTRGSIYGLTGVKEAYRTGKGRAVIRAKADIESNDRGKETIIVTEIPYQVNKANLLIKIKDLVVDGRIEGISEIRDESSNREGLRIVIEIKRDSMASIVLSKLYKYTPLQTSYGINNIALVNGRPVVLNLKQIIEEFIKFRIEVIVRRTKYDLKKAEERAHILEGLLIALDNLDEVIALIRASKTVEEARNGLMSTFELTEIQARAILDMRLQKLTGLEREKIKDEYEELQKKIAHFKAILASEEMQRDIVKEEQLELKDAFGDERNTEIIYADGEINIEDLIPNEEVVITISHLGYIKRTKSDEYRTQSRGGRGARGSKTRTEDFIEHVLIADAHNYMLLFTERGHCFWLRAFEIPVAAKGATGRNIKNIVQLGDDKVKAYIIVKDLKDDEFLNNNFIVFATKKGVIKKTIVEAYSRPRVNGIQAININDGDQLLEAKLTNGNMEILMGAKSGRAIRFPEAKVRGMGRTATGVRGIRLNDKDNDEVIGLVCVDKENSTNTILVVSENGYGKRSDLDEYRVTGRGGKGVKTMNITSKTGSLITIKAVEDTDDLMIVTKSGITIRMPVNDIRVMGRATQGVKVINLGKGESIADVTVISASDTDQEEEGSEENQNDKGES
ncbi:MAG: DNA gyrase subunit A, partial [Bacteroidia bacterium]|nr:DNA gyrase subunit A [Bacteroidia bacterium]